MAGKGKSVKPSTKQNIQYLFIVGILLATVFILVPYMIQFYNETTSLIRKPTPTIANADLPKDLDKWYSVYNSEFFNDKLPRNTVIDWGEYSIDNMGSTTILPDGRFHIAFNEKYCLAERTVRLVLLHEQCHIQTFSEIKNETSTKHGPRWRTCMLNLYQQGAFKKTLIDGYEGN